MSAAWAEGRAVAAPGLALLVPTDVVGVALVAQAASENNVMLDALDLEATFRQVAAGLDLGVFSHAAAFLLAAFFRSSWLEGAPFM
jgi:hypothetical protein